MFRDNLARILVTIACVAATVAYAGWSFTATVGDPATSDELTRALVAHPAVTQRLTFAAGHLAAPLRSAGVDQAAIEEITSEVVSDQRVIDSLSASISGAHRDILAGDRDVVLVLPGAQLTSATRDAAAAHGVDPALVSDLPDTAVSMPAVPALGTTNRLAGRWGDAAKVALVAFVGAFALAQTRALVVRRAGRWMAASAAAALVGPLVATWLTRSSSSMVLGGASTITSVWRDRTQPLLTWVLIAGLALWALAALTLSGHLGELWDRRRGPAGAPVIELPQPGPGGQGRPDGVQNMRERLAAMRAGGRPTTDTAARSAALPEYDPWLDGTVRGGRANKSEPAR